MEIRLLGPVEVRHDGRSVPLGGARPRAVLAMLALAAPDVVSVDRLVDGLWGEDPPGKPVPALQVFVHGVRKALRAAVPDRDVLLSRAPGYLLDVEPEMVDAHRFVRALARARESRATGDHTTAAALLTDAGGLWRGEALADLRTTPFAEPEAVRLEELRLQAEEESFDAALALGRQREMVVPLEERVAAHPTRERFWGQLMVALYRSDRQADALAAYARARDVLADELGIDPGQALQQLELGILRQDPQLAAPAVAAAPRPAAGVGPRRGGRVPAVTTSTYGRDALVEEVVALTARPDVRVVTLAGPGGSGKSRVAVLAAEAAAPAHGGGVWYLTATEQTDEAQLAREITHLLTGSDGDADDPFSALEDHTATAPVLLVLDNLEVVADGSRLVAALVERAPAVTVLATTRLPLRLVAEHEVPVPPLEVPGADATDEEILRSPAVQLFLDRARAGHPGVDAERHLPDVADLCRFLDGVPLALELAAVRVRLLTPPQLLAKLAEGLALLTSSSHDVPERQRALAATIQWSYDRLDADAQKVCDRLALFERGFTVEALEAVCEDVGSVLDALTAILDARLVRAVESRVEVRLVVLGTVRAFARERLRTHPDVEQRREQLAQHLLGRLREWSAVLDGPDGALALGRFEDSEPDVAGAVAWAAATGRVGLAADLVLAALEPWIASGRLHEAQRAVAAVRDATPAGGSAGEERQAELTVAAAKVAYLRTSWETAAALCRQALAQADARPAAGTAAVRATAETYLAGSSVMLGDHEAARQLATAALTTAREHDLYPLTAVALSMLAITHAVAGDVAGERAHYQERLRVVRAHGDAARLADTLNTLAEIALDEGDAEGATAYADESLRIAGELLPLEARDALISRARADCLAGDLPAAAGHAAEALRLGERTGQSLALAQTLRVGGCLAERLGQAALAVRLFAGAQALSPSPTGGDEPAEQDLADRLAAARESLGDDDARRAWTVGGTLPFSALRPALTEVLAQARAVEPAGASARRGTTSHPWVG